MKCDKCDSIIGYTSIQTHISIERVKEAVESISRKHWGILNPLNSFDAINRKVYLTKFKQDSFDGKFAEYLVVIMALELKNIIGIKK